MANLMIPDDGDRKNRQRPDRKRPRPHEARQALANLGETDSRLLTLLLDLRYLRTAQVKALVYPQRKQMYVWQRLNDLQRRGLIANVKIRDGKSSMAYWHVDDLGLRAAEELAGVPEEARTSISEHTVSATFARHYADAAELYVILSQQLPEGAWRWLNHRMQYEYDRVKNAKGVTRPLWLKPDATVQVDYGQTVDDKWQRLGEWTNYVELDRSTMSLTVMAQKLDKYVKWFGKLTQSGEWYGGIDIGHYILIICPSQARATNLQRLLNQRNLPGRAVTLGEAAGMVCGGLNHWWEGLLQAQKDRAAQQRRQKEALEAAAATWVQYEVDLEAWEKARDTWAQQKWDAQLIKTKDFAFYQATYAETMKAPMPSAPTVAKPPEEYLQQARRNRWR